MAFLCLEWHGTRSYRYPCPDVQNRHVCVCRAYYAPPSLQVGWFDDEVNSSGAVAGRLSSDATLLKAAVTDRISILFQNLSVLVTAFTIAFVLSWRMALVVSASLPVLVACALAQQAFLSGMSGDLEKAHHSASTLASEAVTNIRTVAAFGLEERLMGLFRQQLRGPQKRALQRGQVSA